MSAIEELPIADGIPVHRSWYVPGGSVMYAVDFGQWDRGMVVFVHPWFDLRRMEYRPPFYTSRSLGAIERARSRRKKKRAEQNVYLRRTYG